MIIVLKRFLLLFTHGFTDWMKTVDFYHIFNTSNEEQF